MPIQNNNTMTTTTMMMSDGSDHSMSSTFDVASAQHTKDTPPSLPSRRRRRRVVSFDESSNTCFYQHTRVEQEETWYTREELMAFKQAYMKDARQVIRADYEMCQEHNDNNKKMYSYRSVLERVHEACCDTHTVCNEDDIHLFFQWIQTTSPNRLGLERAVCRGLRQDKSIRRRELVVVVLELQQDGASAAELAETAQHISQPSRQFAQLLGQAQAS